MFSPAAFPYSSSSYLDRVLKLFAKSRDTTAFFRQAPDKMAQISTATSQLCMESSPWKHQPLGREGAALEGSA